MNHRRRLSPLAITTLTCTLVIGFVPMAQAGDTPDVRGPNLPIQANTAAAADAALHALLANELGVIVVPPAAPPIVSAPAIPKANWMLPNGSLHNPPPAQPYAGGQNVGRSGRQGAAEARKKALVHRGETLDRLIARVMPRQGFNIKTVRRAFVKLNPDAFPRGTPHYMKAGVTLQVPTAGDLDAMQSGQDLDPRLATAARGAEDRHDWVRYP